MTTSSFKNLTAAEHIFKELIWDPGIRLGETYIEGSVPFLALPVISTAAEGIINELTDWMFSNLVLLVDIEAIKLVNSAHQSAYDQASLRLKVLAHDKGLDSLEFKEARDAAKIALSQFSRFSTQ